MRNDQDNEPVVNTDEWLQTTSEKKAGVQMLTRVPNDINGMAAAYFKYQPPGQDGPIAANEFVAYRLGRLLGLPTARVQFKEFDGKHGVLSYQVATEAVPWNQVPLIIKNDLPLYLDDYETLAHIAIFDTFINNIDRHGDNFMVSRLASPRKTKYQVHLIDHGHALLGASSTPIPNEYDFSRHIILPEIQNLKRHGIEFFREPLKAVGELTEATIEHIINLVPEVYLSAGQKVQMKDMLLQRQKTIYNEVEAYIQS